VAQEMEKANWSGRVLNKCRVTDVLPAPEGAAMMISLFCGKDMCKEKENAFNAAHN